MSVYSVGYTQYLANQKVSAGKWGARMRLYYDEYEALALTAASTIYMFLPVKGAKWSGFGQLAWDDLGTSNTLSVGVSITGAGVAAVVNAFLVATAADAAADMAVLDAGAAAITYLGYEFDGDTIVTITGAGGAHTGTIKLAMLMFGPA